MWSCDTAANPSAHAHGETVRIRNFKPFKNFRRICNVLDVSYTNLGQWLKDRVILSNA